MPGDRFSRCRLCAARDNDDKFVAAEPRKKLAADHGLQSLRDFFQKCVPDRMTEQIVNALEPVEIRGR